jgi:pteridine reductase
VALVTGGAIRVGRAIVETLATAGYRVWIHCHRSGQAAADLVETISRRGAPEPVGVVPADLTQGQQRRALTDRILDPEGPAGGCLDLLVNNAASFEAGAFDTRSDEDLHRVLELNLVAPLSLTRQLLSALRVGSSDEAGPGCVVNILDAGALHPWIGRLDHCTAKAALGAATRALAAELAPVRVNAVIPGTVAWPQEGFAANAQARARALAQIPLGRIGAPSDVGEAVRFMAQARHVTGQALVVDGGRLAALAGRHG